MNLETALEYMWAHPDPVGGYPPEVWEQVRRLFERSDGSDDRLEREIKLAENGIENHEVSP